MQFTKKKIVGLVGAALAAIGVFLPFFTIKFLGQTLSVKFIEGDGKYVLVAVIVAAVFLILGKVKAVSYTFTAGALLITLYDAFANNDAKRTLENVYGVDLKLGIGFYIIIIGLIALGVALFMKSEENESVQIPLFGNNGNNPFNQPQQPVQPTYSAPVNPQPAQPTYSAPVNPQPAQPTYSAPVNPQPAQPTYSAPVEPQQPAQPTYSAPVEPQQPVQPTYSAPVNPQPVQPTYSAPQQPTYNQQDQNNNPNIF